MLKPVVSEHHIQHTALVSDFNGCMVAVLLESGQAFLGGVGTL
jgi:hypothetical protein